MTTSYVYKFTNKVNGKIYIGKSNNPHQRMIRHFSVAKTENKKRWQYQYLHKAINKYGKENFIFEVIEACDSEELALEKERFWIKQLDANNPKFGYNLTSGGDGGCDPETAQKISNTLSGRTNTLNGLLKKLFKIFSLIPNYQKDFYVSENELKRREEVKVILNNFLLENKNYDISDPNKKLSNELKQDILDLYATDKILVKELAFYFNLTEKQINYIISRYKNGLLTEEQKHINRSNSHKGKKLSEEHKRKISLGNMGRITSNETKEKISKANGGENNGMFGKTHSLETREKLSEFQSNRERGPMSEEQKQKNKELALNQDHHFKVSEEIKVEIIDLWNTEEFTKKQLAEKFNLKYNSIVNILRK